MRAEISVTYSNNTTEQCEAIIPDFVAWERHTKRRTSDLAQGIGIEDIAYLAWHANKRTGNTSAPFDKWLENVTDLDIEVGDPKATRKGR